MLLSEYQAGLGDAIAHYAGTHLIVSSHITVDARTPKVGMVKGFVTFADGSRLFFTEYVDARYRLEKLTYSYHFQDKDGGLLFRYDNAAHKPAVPFACHKHLPLGAVTEADPPDFAAVLEEALLRFFH